MADVHGFFTADSCHVVWKLNLEEACKACLTRVPPPAPGWAGGPRFWLTVWSRTCQLSWWPSWSFMIISMNMCFEVEVEYWRHFGAFLGRFWDHFGRLLDWFLKLFGNMLGKSFWHGFLMLFRCPPNLDFLSLASTGAQFWQFCQGRCWHRF